MEQESILNPFYPLLSTTHHIISYPLISKTTQILMENIPRDTAWARFSLPRKCHSDHIKCIRQSMSVFITTHISIVWSGKKEITVAFSQQHTHNTRWDVTLEICSVWPSDFPYYSFHPSRIPFIFHFFYFKAPKLTLSGYVGGGGLHRWFIVPCWEM